jgi:hypothetical protein
VLQLRATPTIAHRCSNWDLATTAIHDREERRVRDSSDLRSTGGTGRAPGAGGMPGVRAEAGAPVVAAKLCLGPGAIGGQRELTLEDDVDSVYYYGLAANRALQTRLLASRTI